MNKKCGKLIYWTAGQTDRRTECKLKVTFNFVSRGLIKEVVWAAYISLGLYKFFGAFIANVWYDIL
jgi:hypothetical protein